MRVAYFDCFSGAAGDMIVASLVDAGADADTVRHTLAKLNLSGYRLDIHKKQKQGFDATSFDVTLTDQEHQPHRHLSRILDMLRAADLSSFVKQRAGDIFTRLGEAEAKVHGTSIEKVHFHEVGAVDSLLDIVGAVIAMENLGIERVFCSPIPLGSGTVKCAHGVLPVPAPATAALMTGIPTKSSDADGEMLTPTGAAILTTLAESFGHMPDMDVQSIGYGAGTRETPGLPNLLRVFVGEMTAAAKEDRVVVLETNIDDTTPEIVAHAMDRLLAEGALDVFAQPIQMKKSRAGVLLSVLCHPIEVEALQRVLFAETTTFGIRRYEVDRAIMDRRHEVVATRFGEIRIKIGQFGGIATASPEFEDCRSAAEAHNVPVREVLAAASVAYEANRHV